MISRNGVRFIISIWCCWIGLLSSSYAGDDSVWRQVAPGIAYQSIPLVTISPISTMHIFRVSLKSNHLDLVVAHDHQASHLSVQQMANLSHALIAVNGGFFTPEAKMLGLRVQRGKMRNPIKGTNWWGVFYIRQQQAHIIPYKAYDSHQAVSFAIQAGPRIVIDGKVPKLKAGFAERTALGIDKQGRVLLLTTQNAFMTTTALAQILLDPRYQLHCQDAINLDGGSSSQLFARFKALQVHVPSFSAVTDGIIVLPNVGPV